MVAIVMETMAAVTGNRNQRSWTSQQLLCAPRPRSPPFISKLKEIGGCVEHGNDSAMIALHLVHHKITA
jgi:hypothetical protein